MKRINLECICELAENMTVYVNNGIKCGDYPIISAYCKFDVARDLVESLIRMGNSLGNIIELEEYEMSYYDKEFVIYLSKDGIACEKCYHENTYYYGGGDVSYVHEDCNSKLLDYIESDVVFKFGFNDEDTCEPMCGSECCGRCDCDEDDSHEVDCEDDKVNCEIKFDDNGYSISVKCNLDADEAMKIIKDMEHRIEHMNDMFREMDYFRRLLRW